MTKWILYTLSFIQVWTINNGEYVIWLKKDETLFFDFLVFRKYAFVILFYIRSATSFMRIICRCFSLSLSLYKWWYASMFHVGLDLKFT